MSDKPMNPAEKQEVPNKVLYVKLDGYQHQGRTRMHGTNNLVVKNVRRGLMTTDQKIEEIGEEEVRFLFFSPTKTKGTFPHMGDDLVVEYLYFSKDQLTSMFKHRDNSTHIVLVVQRNSTVPDLSISKNEYEFWPTFNEFDNVVMKHKMFFLVTWEHLESIYNNKNAVVIGEGF